ncbi:MAG TPA: DsbA family protein [Novosphingobium sp.]|nr:DsbA family protein [Novosphingobium sp.]
MPELKDRSSLALILGGLALLGLGAAGGWAFEKNRSSALNRAEVEQVVREYILAHPEILPEAIERLRAKENSKQVTAAGDEVFVPFPGAVMGNPAGKTTLVMFTDFACGYCRSSMKDVEALIAEDPDLKVVMRELPIIAPTSPNAARWGLAAAEQGRYPAFHRAMFAAGRTDQASIDAAARAAGLDLERARRFAADPKVTAEIEANIAFARGLQLEGTPAWVIGDQLMTGAVGKDLLAKAIAEEKAKS